MFRTLARLGAAVGLAAALIMTSGTAALAAPSSFDGQLYHSGGGALAVRTTGSISWSSSLKTATISNTRFWAKGGECVALRIAGYQGNNRVTDQYLYPGDGSDWCPRADTWIPVGSVPFTSKVPGGVQALLIVLEDRGHDRSLWEDCIQADNFCTESYHNDALLAATKGRH